MHKINTIRSKNYLKKKKLQKIEKENPKYSKSKRTLKKVRPSLKNIEVKNKDNLPGN